LDVASLSASGRMRDNGPVRVSLLLEYNTNFQAASFDQHEANRKKGAKKMVANLDKRVSIRLESERFDQLDAFARREGFSVSLVVRHLVCRFLEDQQRQSVMASQDRFRQPDSKRRNPRTKKLPENLLDEIMTHKAEFGLSLFQCVLWLERKHGISVSRTTVQRRMQSSGDYRMERSRS